MQTTMGFDEKAWAGLKTPIKEEFREQLSSGWNCR